ncbi:hypothetical protein [Microbacterium sp. SA39]|uniref:hypothetical protein n=1 Tax=Microbacterium sp. SA39 TaxID=1263625 RepID=UPI000A84D939|nr:hypothetical protein [Microbacterium sp. SA39]
MTGSCRVETLVALTDSDAVTIERLLRQLSSSAMFDRPRIEWKLNHDATELLVARLKSVIVGRASAVARGLRSLELTSRPYQEAALRLYASVGFVPRDTNVLRYTP